MSRFDEIAQEDGWQVDGFPGALESAAADGIAWKLLDLTMDVADREPSKEDIREAMVTGERILAGVLADAAEAEQRAASAEAERDRYAEREEAFSRGLRVADAGRYRADWPGAVETTIRRAERAEAELAALRERVRGRAWAFDAMGQHVHADGLRDLLDDDTTGAASGEGEVADSCTYCASQIKQAQERRVKTEQECERLEDLRPKPGDSGYAGYAQMFNDITFAPIVTHLLFSDRGRMADALWAAGYRKTEGEK